MGECLLILPGTDDPQPAGPPETHKTMLARGLPTVPPALMLEESLDTTRICSAADRLDRQL